MLGQTHSTAKKCFVAVLAALVGGLGLVGCGGDAPGKVNSVAQVTDILYKEGYRPSTESTTSERPYLSFGFEPRYGKVVAVYKKDELTILVVRGNRSTKRPDNPALYWLRSGNIILIGLPPPPFTSGKVQFETLVNAL